MFHPYYHVIFNLMLNQLETCQRSINIYIFIFSFINSFSSYISSFISSLYFYLYIIESSIVLILKVIEDLINLNYIDKELYDQLVVYLIKYLEQQINYETLKESIRLIKLLYQIQGIAVIPYFEHPQLYSILIYISGNDQLNQDIRIEALDLIGSIGVVGIQNYDKVDPLLIKSNDNNKVKKNNKNDNNNISNESDESNEDISINEDRFSFIGECVLNYEVYAEVVIHKLINILKDSSLENLFKDILDILKSIFRNIIQSYIYYYIY